MDQTTFQAADPHVDTIAEIVDELLASDDVEPLRQALVQLAEAIGGRYGVGLNVNVQVFENDGERALPLLSTGLSVTAGEEPYRTWGDSSPHRYVVDGQIQVVPHDRCPKCWEEWDFKFRSLSCEHCGATLGENCKVLLDGDVCPSCENGTVSVANPTCDRCGFKVDLKMVAWG